MKLLAKAIAAARVSRIHNQWYIPLRSYLGEVFALQWPAYNLELCADFNQERSKYNGRFQMTTHVADAPKSGWLAKVWRFALHEFREMLPPVIFFFIGFNLILFTKRLILAEYLIQFTGFFIATMSALIVGKVVLVADAMPFLRRFDYAPLAQPILFKTVVYALLVFVARLLEAFIHYVAGGGTVGHGGFIEEQLGTFSWNRFIATQMWIFVLFLVYVTASEFNKLLGDSELFKILFTRRSSELKTTRRERIRLLIRLSRLTDAHSIETLGDPTTGPHAELVGILRNMASNAQRA
jgi:hypothetical protein